MENFKTDTCGNSRDTSDTSSYALLPFGRKRCRWTRTRTWSPCRWLSTLFGGYGYGAFVTLLFEPGCRHLIICTADVRPKRHGNVADRTTLGRRCPSEHHDPGAEASRQATKAAAARGYPQHHKPLRVSWN